MKSSIQPINKPCEPTDRLGKTISEFFKVHEGGDVVLVRNLAMKRFKIDEATFNYWLGQYRFAC